jgi:hypothetical protein
MDADERRLVRPRQRVLIIRPFGVWVHLCPSVVETTAVEHGSRSLSLRGGPEK